jgi:hypothetical protein
VTLVGYSRRHRHQRRQRLQAIVPTQGADSQTYSHLGRIASQAHLETGDAEVAGVTNAGASPTLATSAGASPTLATKRSGGRAVARASIGHCGVGASPDSSGAEATAKTQTKGSGSGDHTARESPQKSGARRGRSFQRSAAEEDVVLGHT